MKIFVLSHDLSHNCVGRAVLLARLFGLRHEVEVLGACFGPDIWFPVRQCGIRFRKVDGELFLPQYTHLMARLLSKLKGDVILAVKPRPTSFGLALMHRKLHGRPVILDIDDDEMAYYSDSDWRAWDPRDLLRRPNSPLYTALLEDLIPTADAVIGASRLLCARHGGLYLPHVKDPESLNPANYERDDERRKRDLPLDERIVVFAGSPREHKGLEQLLEAVRRLELNDVKVLIAGASNDPDNAYERRLREVGGERLYMFKQMKESELPAILAMADLVALPQLDTPFARAQMPSKLFDAMAMGLPIVASTLSDIPEALAGDCGLVVPPGDVGALGQAIAQVLGDPAAARAMGARARQRLVQRYSNDALQSRVDEILAHALRRQAATP